MCCRYLFFILALLFFIYFDLVSVVVVVDVDRFDYSLLKPNSERMFLSYEQVPTWSFFINSL